MSITTQTLILGAKKFPVLIISGFVSILLLVFLYFRADTLAAQRVELDNLSQQGARYRSNVGNAAQLQEQLNFIIKANEAVKVRSLPVDAMAVNLQYFYRLESEAGVKYLDLRPAARPHVTKTGNKDAQYIPMGYTIGVQGRFPQVITYLKSLEQGAYFCRITNASISSVDDMVTLTLNLDLLGSP